jgi:hypothetical protein
VSQKDSAYTLDDLPDLIEEFELSIVESSLENNKPFFENALEKAKDAMEKINQINGINALCGSSLASSLNRAYNVILANAKKAGNDCGLGINEDKDLCEDTIRKSFQKYKEENNITEVNGRLQIPKAWYIRRAVKGFQKLEKLCAQLTTFNGIVHILENSTVNKRLKNLDNQLEALYQKLPPEGQEILASREEGDLTINDLYDVQTALTKLAGKSDDLELSSDALGLLADLKKQTDDMINIRESSEKITAKMQLLTDVDCESFQNKIENLRQNRSTKAPTPEEESETGE